MIKQYNMRLVKWSARPSFALNRHKNHSGSSKGLSLTGFGVFFYKERDIFRKINLQCFKLDRPDRFYKYSLLMHYNGVFWSKHDVVFQHMRDIEIHHDLCFMTKFISY